MPLSFVWAPLIIKNYFVNFCGQIAFLIFAFSPSMRYDLSQGSFSSLLGLNGVTKDILVTNAFRISKLCFPSL